MVSAVTVIAEKFSFKTFVSGAPRGLEHPEGARKTKKS